MQVKLVDLKDEIPEGLNPREGLDKWRVYYRPSKEHDPQWFNSYEETPDRRKRVLKETLFDQVYTLNNNDPSAYEVIDPLNLKRCLRFFPQDQNYGGFFVAVFEKTFDSQTDRIFGEEEAKEDLPERTNILDDLERFVSKLPETQDQTELTELVQKAINDRDDGGDGNEAKFSYEPIPAEEFKELNDYFGLAGLPQDRLYRQKASHKNIQFLSPTLKQVCKMKMKHKLKIMTIGTRLFHANKVSHVEAHGHYRMVQEGADILFPLITKRKIEVSKEFLKTLFEKAVKITELPEELESLKSLRTGSLILYWQDPADESFRVVCCAWLGQGTLALMLSKDEIQATRPYLE